MRRAYVYETVIGRMLISEDELGITEVTLIMEEDNSDYSSRYEIMETEMLKEASRQISEYLDGSRMEFTVLLHPQGTEFQRKVWEALRNIPYGETRSYKQIAEEVGNPKASRAVGMANHNNPIMCIIPCHRVIGANGSLTGYAGGLHTKEKLLGLEKKKGSK